MKNGKKVFISYSYVMPDENLANYLEQYLTNHGHQVFIDKQILVGTNWAKEIYRQINTADVFVVLLSEKSIYKEMVRQEVKLAYKLSQSPDKDFIMLPIRVAFKGELPYDLGAYLDPLQYALWEPDIPFEKIGAQIKAAIEESLTLLKSGKTDIDESSASGMEDLFNTTEGIGVPLPSADPRLVPQIEMETGIIRLNSPFYIKREADDIILQQVQKSGTTTIIKGPRQIGKSSLLARVHANAKNNNLKSCYIDFQMIDSSCLESLDNLFRYLARKMSKIFKTSINPDEVWDKSLGAKDNITDFIEEALLFKADVPVLILFDEVDCLFDCPYRDAFFATIRSWHNNRAMQPCWNYLNIIIAHSTEPYLWIQDINQSPFNVGYTVQLNDFSFDQISQLNEKYNHPLKGENEIHELMDIIGGQPYLVRQSLYTLVTNKWSVSKLKEAAGDEMGPFGDHLRRIMWYLVKNKDLKNSVQKIIRRGMCEKEVHFQKLRASGLIVGESRNSVQMRYKLYNIYLKKFL